jgi:thiol-disulfide isomerase/thioredoxin
MTNHLKTSIVAIVLLSSIQVSAQQFTLSGTLNGPADAPVILSYTNSDGLAIKDSTAVQNGSFSFKGNITGGILANLSISSRSSKFKPGENGNNVNIFLEPATITATGRYDNLKDLKVSGSKSQAEYEILQSRIIPYLHQTDPLEQEWLALQKQLFSIENINKDDPRLKAIDTKMDSLNNIMVDGAFKIYTSFVDSYPNSYVSAYILNSYKTRWTLKRVKTTYNNFSLEVQRGFYGEQVGKLIGNIEDNSAGKIAKNFTAVDLNGKALSLTDLKGKYVLLDFWGSWCGPCRASTPHVKDLFTKYHQAGLEVLAIAVDDTPADWKKAIEKDGTAMFYNIMQEHRNAANKDKLIDDQYQIHVFPTKILVGKDGIIIGRYDGTESTTELDNKLAAIFN